jgi:hypothetical protein
MIRNISLWPKIMNQMKSVWTLMTLKLNKKTLFNNSFESNLTMI